MSLYVLIVHETLYDCCLVGVAERTQQAGLQLQP